MSANGSDDGLAGLCESVQQLVPEAIGKEAWYLVTAAILISSPKPDLLAELYKHLTTHNSAFSTREARSRLSQRMRDVLLKLVTLIGAPQVLCALIPLAKAEGDPESQSQSSTLSSKWHDMSVPAIHARGVSTIDTIYGPTLLPKVFASFGSHSQDVQFMELFTVYGMYLSDFSQLTPLETEAIVFVTIMCTGLRGPSLWHMRGMGRLLGARGIEENTAEMNRIKNVLRDLKVAAATVVQFCGEDMVKRSGLEGEIGWVNVGDVSRELGGWGDDPYNQN